MAKKTTEVKEKHFTLFEHISNLTQQKVSWDKYKPEDIADFNPFMINLMLSHNIELIELVNMFQQYTVGVLDKREVYKLYLGLLPKKKIFIKYIKGDETEENKYYKEASQYIKHYFKNEISTDEAFEYIQFISSDDMTNILNSLGVEDKEIKKIIKHIYEQ